MDEKEVLKAIKEIEEAGREELKYSNLETEDQHGYGVMDAMQELRNKLNIEE